ncbi:MULTISPECIES: NF041680 family putative transposase [Streptomyces]|uniref:NF041680 family putative transposase n=1 Tax=Streptomyces TaxID=1883 RepID=UPI0005189A12|nr:MULTISPECIES: NF041680 family putative transposase [Streptomyces]KOT64396.1 transposase [Streptomyces rimosus subsp. rimosus]
MREFLSGPRREAYALVSRFRDAYFACLSRRRDELFELTDAVLCAEGPVKSPVDLTLLAEHRRGHGALYGGLGRGGIDVERLRRLLAGLPLPRFEGGRLVLAVDVSPWLRPDAPCSAERLFCHVYGRAKDDAQVIPGWPYSFVAALEPGATSWTAILDVVRLGPADDATAITAAQLRDVVQRLVVAGQWRAGDADITIVADAGYDLPRLAWVLRDLPVEVVGRLRSDRVLRLPKPPYVYDPWGGRPPKHGPQFHINRPQTWPEPAVTTFTDTTRYGKAQAQAWDRVHPRLTHRSAWLDHPGELPVIEGTVIRLKVEHLSKGRDAPPVWLWSSGTGATAAEVDRWWQGYLRRFDLEHTFRFAKQTLGWTTPKIRTPQAADRWTWLLVVAHTQLRLVRSLTVDLRRPWEKPADPERMTPARVRRGFRNIRAHLACPARVPKPRGTGPGRPPGTRNRRPAPRYDVGKTVKREPTLVALRNARR